MPITLKYNKLKALVRFKKPLSQVPLSELIEEASLFSSLPKNEIKLIFAGATMNNQEASLASYGIEESSKVLILATKPQPPPIPSRSDSILPISSSSAKTTTNTSVNEETNLVTKINTIVNKVLDEIESSKVRFFASEEKTQEVDKLKLYLSEKLLQGLLSLDGIQLDFQFSKARESRKAAVHQIQDLLEAIDEKYNSLVLNHQTNLA